MNVSKLQQPPTSSAAPTVNRSIAGVKRGRIETPVRVFVYGPEGLGKSTFAAGAPNPFFLSFDARTNHLDIARERPKDWDDALGWVRQFELEKHDYKTLVLDPLNHLEPMCWAKVTGGLYNIEEHLKGFGKGYTAAMDHWRQLVAQLERLWSVCGMNIVLVAHSTIKKFDDPEGPGWDRYEPALQKLAAGLFKQWVDFVLLAKKETYAKKDETSGNMKGAFTGRHMLYVRGGAAYDGKWTGNPPKDGEVSLDWGSFDEALRASRRSPAELRARIEALVKEVDLPATTADVEKYLKQYPDDISVLLQIINQLEVKKQQKADAPADQKG